MPSDLDTEQKKRPLRPEIRGRRIVLFLLLLVICSFAFQPWTAPAQGPPDGGTPVKPKRILVLCSYGYALPAYQKFNPAFISVMERAGVRNSDLVFEYLDLLHIRDKEQRRALADMLRHKYAELNIDLIVTLHPLALSFLLDEAKDIFPNVPIISWSLKEALDRGDREHRILRLQVELDVRGTLERTLELFPQTSRVVFVSGVSEEDRQLERQAKSVFANWEGRLQFEYTSDYSVEEVLQRVSNLPSRTVIIYWSIFRDKTGRTFTPRDVGKMIAKTANAPVFALYDTLMGFGVIGGSLQSFEADGVQAGKLALDILNGKLVLTEPLTTIAINKLPMFDWQQIERWGGKAENLPEGTLFVNRSHSMWNQYGKYLIGFIIFTLAQSFLIVSLLIQKRRRKLAEETLEGHLRRLEDLVKERTEDLLNQREWLRVTLTSIGDAVIATDTEGQVTFINPVAAELTGWQMNEAKGQRIEEVFRIINEQTREPAEDIVLHVLHDGKIALLANHTALVTRDGREIPIEDSAAPIRDKAGEVSGVVLVFHDVTEKRRTREALKESEKLYRSLFDNMLNGFAYCRMLFEENEPKDFIYLNVNRTFETLTGLKNVMGKKVSEIIPGIRESDPDLFKIYGKVARTGIPERFETYLEALDMWFSISVYSPRKDHFVAVFDVITERKRAEDALQTQRKLLEIIVNHLPAAVSLIRGSDLRIQLVNPTFQAIAPGKDMVGDTIDGLWPQAQRSFVDLCRQVLATGQPHHVEDELFSIKRSPDGPLEPAYFCWSLFRVHLSEERGWGLLHTAWEVTERKQIEEQTRRLLATVQEERDRLSALISSIPDEVWFADARKKFTLANPSALSHFSLASDADTDIERLAVSLEVLRPDGSPRPVEEAPPLRSLKGETVRNLEEIVRVPASGELRYRQVSSSPVRDASGNIVGSVSVVRDITERKKMEDELRHLNQILRALSDTNQAAIHAEDEPDFLNEVCRIIVQDCGHPMVWIGFAEDDENKTVKPVAQAGFEEGYLETIKITWSDRELGRGPTGTAIRTGTPDVCKNMLTESRMRPWRDQAIKRGYASSVALPLRAGGQTLGALTIYSREPESFSEDEVNLLSELADDLTYGITVLRLRLAHLQSEQRLRESQTRLDLALRSASMGAWHWDIAENRRYFDDQSFYLLGIDPATFIGTAEEFFAVLHHDDGEKVRRALARTLERDVPYETEYRAVWPDGGVHYIAARGKLARDDQGRPVRLNGLIWDISEHKRMEEELRKSRDELELRVLERTAELTTTIARLELLNQELQEFAYVASHDLQEPLRKIQTFCDMAQKRCAPVLDSTSKDYLDRVVSSAGRMRQLLHDLLQFSRSAVRPEPFKKIDLCVLAREAADVFETSDKETGCQIEIENIPAIEADESQMLRLFQNLIGNAVKFRSDETPHIKICGRLDEQGKCEISVKDNGIGFAPKFAELIFKPFQRLHGRSEYEGTGMGLAICRKIVERHGGEIRAESELGKGSTFIIRLPVKQINLENISSAGQRS